MKHLKTTLLIGLLSIIFAPTLFAQNIDANRMNRDIRIMENILAELFRTQAEIATAEALTIVDGELRQRGVRGTYLKDFGIIFMIPLEDPFAPRMHVTGQGGYSFYYSTDSNQEGVENSRQIDEQTVKVRMSEFLMDYASTIGQLKDEERIMIIYGSQSNSKASVWNYRIAVNGTVIDDQTSEEAMPVISASILVKDLREYRQGRLDEAEIKQRIDFATTEDKEYLDLKVMSNIFETALRDPDEGAFRISGGIGYMMLDNFGAIYSFNARFGSGRNLFFGRLAESQQRLRILQEREVRGNRRPQTNTETVDLEEQQALLKEEMISAYGGFKTAISEYLVDYGRTLNSVSSDQFILTSARLSSGGIEDIPGRVDFQIKKSVLEQFDRGRISREEAISAVSITEY